MGATAGGKTSLAALAAEKLNGEIISADSRQVYRGMDIGTGKDLSDYVRNGKQIPFHLIDIVDAGEKYNVYEFQRDFLKAFDDIRNRNRFPILCGGTGMYIQAVLEGYRLTEVPPNLTLRAELEMKSDVDLIEILTGERALHNVSDISNRKRLIRAVEIALFYKENPQSEIAYPKINSLNIQVVFDRDSRRRRITQRLKERLENGMIDEVRNLLQSGVSAKTLQYYGLEYKFLTDFILGKLSYEQMFTQLETAIHQFSKRQMTWFRKMENDGYKIHKIDGFLHEEKKWLIIKDLLESGNF
jgi:tRNA dimethylallyltransferase